MNITWLYGLDHMPETFSAEWHKAYDDWIAHDPAMRGQFGDHRTSKIYACSVRSCSYVQEMRDAVGQIACGHGSPYYVRFGEHERQAVQDAIDQWRDGRLALASKIEAVT